LCHIAILHFISQGSSQTVCSMQHSIVATALLLISASAGSVPIATFDGVKATTLEWQTVNDPVMGGKSVSSFKVDGKTGVWAGEVAIVPFLKAPGFCNLQSPGLGKTADFPDLSGCDGIILRAKETDAKGLSQFNVQLMSKGAKHWFSQGVYMASVNITALMTDVFVPWSAFTCSVRGSKVSWCPELSTQLKQINSVGVGTFFPGTAGPFNIEIESMSGRSSSVSLEESSYLDLATFDGKAPHTWHSENDPVMGGKSSSAVKQQAASLDYSGTTRIVPALKAPGFTIAMTENPLVSHFPDVSAMDGLTVSIRQVGGSNFTGYKLAFCDSHINFYRCQMETFKADLVIPAGSDFQEVFVPWSKFSDKWNPATGKHTAENPPTASSLKSITQLQLWTEAQEGDFHVELQYVRASKAPAVVPKAIIV